MCGLPALDRQNLATVYSHIRTIHHNLDHEEYQQFLQVLNDVTCMRIPVCVAFSSIREIVKRKPALWKNFRSAYELCRTQFDDHLLHHQQQRRTQIQRPSTFSRQNSVRRVAKVPNSKRAGTRRH